MSSCSRRLSLEVTFLCFLFLAQCNGLTSNPGGTDGDADGDAPDLSDPDGQTPDRDTDEASPESPGDDPDPEAEAEARPEVDQSPETDEDGDDLGETLQEPDLEGEESGGGDDDLPYDCPDDPAEGPDGEENDPGDTPGGEDDLSDGEPPLVFTNPGVCPGHDDMVRVVDSSFCIDRFEAAVEDGRAVSLPGAVPRSRVSWQQARDACGAAGKDLCPSAVWRHACNPAAGQCPGMAFPYGCDFSPGNCVDPTAFDLSATCAAPQTTGSREGCVSALGVFDMSGNLFEWTLDADDQGRRAINGGSFWHGGGFALACTTQSFASPGWASPDQGFRCCLNAAQDAGAVLPESLPTPVPALPAMASPAGACPAHPEMARIDGICMDRFEAVLCADPLCASPLAGDDGGFRGYFFPDAGDGEVSDGGYPTRLPDQELYACSLEGVASTGYVTWFQAQRACANQGKRLCRYAELAAACQGTAGDAYPYGPGYKSGWCLDEGFCGSAFVNGAGSSCASDAGVYDLLGNRFEWTGDHLHDGRLRGIFGSSQFYPDYNLLTCHTPLNGSHPLWAYPDFGFRCCLDAP